MPFSQLTATSVERAFRAQQRFLLNDGQGLYLRKRASSGASWTLRYRFLERDRWMTLGNYPDMGLAEARVEARAKRIFIDKQQDPLDARKAALQAKRDSGARERNHFKSLAEDWFAMEIAGRVKNPAAPRRYIDKYLVPEFGAKCPADITPEEAARLLGRVSRKAPTAANDLLRYTKRIFRFGVRRRRLAVSPVSDFNSRDAGGVERHRDRALSQDELVIFLEAMRKSDAFGGQNYLTMKLLLALGVRKGELIRATWDEFELEGRNPVRSEIAERCLNHRLRGVEGVYNTHDYFEERRAALGAWTNLLLDIESGVKKVTPINRIKSPNQVR